MFQRGICSSSTDPELLINPRQAFPAVWHTVSGERDVLLWNPQACKRSLGLPWGRRLQQRCRRWNGAIFKAQAWCEHMRRVAFRGNILWQLSWGGVAQGRCDGFQSLLISSLQQDVDVIVSTSEAADKISWRTLDVNGALLFLQSKLDKDVFFEPCGPEMKANSGFQSDHSTQKWK